MKLNNDEIYLLKKYRDETKMDTLHSEAIVEQGKRNYIDYLRDNNIARSEHPPELEVSMTREEDDFIKMMRERIIDSKKLSEQQRETEQMWKQQ